MNRSLVVANSFALLVVLFCVSAAHAASFPGVEWTGTTSSGAGNGPWCMGYKFQANQSLEVYLLGVYDHGGDGLAESHAVGIFNQPAGQLVASVTVLAGTSSSLYLDHFRYESLNSPVTLLAGHSYIVAAAGMANTGGDSYGFAPVGFTVDPAISFIEARHADTSSLIAPYYASPLVNGYFGGNFRFLPISIPEPATGALLILGCVALGVTSRRRAGCRLGVVQS